MQIYLSLPHRWDSTQTRNKSEPELLLYRSNLLGSELAITNFGGGNTSAKIPMPDPLSQQPEEVLWVKGSGGDLGSMQLDGFATLYQNKLMQLENLFLSGCSEDEMVERLPLCNFGNNARAPSIDTPLHAYLPYRHVDHMHPDAVIAIATTPDSESWTQEIFEGRIGWLPWQRPGFELGLKLRDLATAQPDLYGVLLAGHGLFTWGDDARECYTNTVNSINQALAFLAARQPGKHPFGQPSSRPLAESAVPQLLYQLAPRLRRLLRQDSESPTLNAPTVAHFSRTPELLEFVCSEGLESLAKMGTSCPDHFLRTKIRPLVLPVDALANDTRLDELLRTYRSDYREYYKRCRHPDSPPMRNPNPVVFLIPEVGILTFARNKQTARIAAEFYANAVHVMHGANLLNHYQALPEQEAFDIEYWALEEAKLQRMPPPPVLEGQVALITGAAGGIGGAVAHKLADQGACVVLSDIDEPHLIQRTRELQAEFGLEKINSCPMDVTSEASVQNAIRLLVGEFGGLDILVANAGLASASNITDTDLELWQRNHDVLSTGYFLTTREGFRIMQQQGWGNMVFVGSKNALAASAGAAAYSSAKASELHLARCLALEGAPHGIRVNTVNPDAVLEGSKIWNSKWREERARAYAIEPEELEEYYRNRSLLKRSVHPADIAEAVFFLSSSASSLSTGNIINVDGGNAAAFPR